MPTPREIMLIANNNIKFLADNEMEKCKTILDAVKINLQKVQYTTHLEINVRDEIKPLFAQKIREELENAGWIVQAVEWEELGSGANVDQITVAVEPPVGVKTVECLMKKQFEAMGSTEDGKNFIKGSKYASRFPKFSLKRSTEYLRI